MKRILFIIAISLFFLPGIQAQDVTPLWEKSKPVAREAGRQLAKEHLAVTADGELYAAGRFSETFAFAGQDLEPIANSSYLIKYDNNGNELWGVSIAGAAAVTGITLDETGNVFLTGSMADEVVFNTTSGTAITKKGVTGTELISAFVAKYNAAGAVQAVEVFNPVELDVEYEATPEIYFSDIQAVEGKTYVSAILKGKVTNNEITISSTTANLWGIGYYVDLQSGFILSLTDDLKFENVISEISATENNGMVMIDVFDAVFTIDNNVMYIGYVATGNQTMKIGSNTKDITLNTPEGGAWQYVYQFAAYNLSTKATPIYKDYIVEHDAGFNRCRLTQLTPTAESIIAEGTFNGAPLVFDNTLEHKGADDVFAVILKKSDFTVIKAFTSGIDEGDPNKNEEIWFASSFAGNNLIQIIMTSSTEETPTTAYVLNVDLEQNTSKVLNQNTAMLPTGLSVKGLNGAVSIVNPSTSTINYKMGELIVSSAKALQATDIAIYPNPVLNTINFSEACDVELIGITGSLIKTAQSVTSLDVSNLASGIYFVSVTNEKGSETIKIVKK